MKKQLTKLINESIAKLSLDRQLKDIFFTLTHPREERRGDWSTNVAMQLASLGDKSAMEIGKELVGIMNKKIVHYDLAKIDLVKPGFINFYVAKQRLDQELTDLLKMGHNYGAGNQSKGKKIMVEFISANPTGPLTLGNARGGFLGDVIARVLEFAGHKVHKEYYVNDSGKQIEALGHSILKDKEASYRGDYINNLHKRNKLKDPVKAGEWASGIILSEMIKKTVARMKIDFDTWFSEKSLYDQGKPQEIIEELGKKGFLKDEDGARWLVLSKFDYGPQKEKKDCVLVKSDGKFTYLAGDIAYHKNKFFERKFDKVINLWGADHYDDTFRLQAGVEAIGIKPEERLKLIIFQFVRLIRGQKEVKMSKRKGTYVTIDELLDKISLDVARFFFLMHDPNSHMDFDLELARDKSEKNPVYYIQYAHARICSIVDKAGPVSMSRANMRLLKEKTELDLIKVLIRFPEIIQEIAENYEAHHLAYYALSLAEKFHRFYKQCRVIGEDKKLSKVRLSLIKATQIVLKNTLSLMGISAPEKM